MNKLIDRSEPEDGRVARGVRRRAALVDAAVDLLAEHGWAGVTTHEVARRAGVAQSLVHYHLGDLAGLRAAVAERVSRAAIGEAVEALVADADERVALDRLAAALEHPDETARHGVAVTTEVIGEALRDPVVAGEVAVALQEARARLAGWLSEQHPDWPDERVRGAAVLLAALVDGLFLHRLLDDRVAVVEAIGALRDLVDHGAAGPTAEAAG